MSRKSGSCLRAPILQNGELSRLYLDLQKYPTLSSLRPILNYVYAYYAAHPDV
jgi:hypothetical protein